MSTAVCEAETEKESGGWIWLTPTEVVNFHDKICTWLGSRTFKVVDINNLDGKCTVQSRCEFDGSFTLTKVNGQPRIICWSVRFSLNVPISSDQAPIRVRYAITDEAITLEYWFSSDQHNNTAKPFRVQKFEIEP